MKIDPGGVSPPDRGLAVRRLLHCAHRSLSSDRVGADIRDVEELGVKALGFFIGGGRQQLPQVNEVVDGNWFRH